VKFNVCKTSAAQTCRHINLYLVSVCGGYDICAADMIYVDKLKLADTVCNMWEPRIAYSAQWLL